jgi:hypothetical protein
MQQWIDIEPIEARAVNRPGEPFEVHLQFEAVNNTPYVLTIEKIITRIDMMPPDSEIFTVSTNVSLAPKGNGRSSVYPFYVRTKEIEKLGFGGGTVVTVNGEVTFRDCLKDLHIDWFGGLYKCAPEYLVYLKPAGLVPDQKKEKHPHNPN